MIWIAIAVVIIIIVLIVVAFIDSNRFIVLNEEFKLPDIKKNFKFVMISDLHNKTYGHQNDKIIEKIEKANPDFIIVVGDLITAHLNEDMEAGINLLNRLSEKYPIYYSMGNHETRIKEDADFGDRFEILLKKIKHPNLVLLDNQSIDLEECGICLSGLTIERKYFKHFKKVPMSEDYVTACLGMAKSNVCNILMAHNPDYFKEYAAWGADLVLSGHVHGGIMRLPVIGGVIAPSYILFPKYDGGIFVEGKSTMLLGRGLGAHTIPIRIFNPAEIHIVNCLRK